MDDGTILVILDNPRNRTLLEEWLSQYHPVVVADDLDDRGGAHALCILDGPALDRLWTRVQACKEAEAPTFWPVLLVTTRKDLRLVTRHLWKTVDDLILTPIEKVELQARVEILLRARRLSVELHRHYRRLVESARDILFRFELAPHPRLTYVSPAVENILGYTPEELCSRPEMLLDIVHPDDRADLARALRGEVLVETPRLWRWVARDGRVVWTEQHRVAVRDSQGRPVAIVGVARDVTERVLAGERLRILHAIDRALLDEEPPEAIGRLALERLAALVPFDLGGVWRLEEERAVPVAVWPQEEGVDAEPVPLVEIADVVEHLEREGVYRLDDVETLPPTSPQTALARRLSTRSVLAAALRARETFQGAMVLLARRPAAFTEADAAILREVADQVAIALYQADLRSALEQYTRHLEEMVEQRTRELARSEALYRQLAENPLAGVWMADENGVFTFINRRITEMSGYTPEDVIGKMTMLDVIAPEMREWLMKRMAAHRAGQLVADVVEAVLVRKDGSRFVTLNAPATLYDPETGEFKGFLGIMIDISERKRLEDELSAQMEEYRRLVRLMADREVRMAELKEVIRQLREQLIEAGLTPVADDPLRSEG